MLSPPFNLISLPFNLVLPPLDRGHPVEHFLGKRCNSDPAQADIFLAFWLAPQR
jgi:hypothetical protein